MRILFDRRRPRPTPLFTTPTTTTTTTTTTTSTTTTTTTTTREPEYHEYDYHYYDFSSNDVVGGGGDDGAGLETGVYYDDYSASEADYDYSMTGCPGSLRECLDACTPVVRINQAAYKICVNECLERC